MKSEYSSAWSHLTAEFRSWISSLSLWASSCSCALSCCILLMYSAVFCSVVALLICASRHRDYYMFIYCNTPELFTHVTVVTFINMKCFSSYVKPCITSCSLPFSTCITNAAARLYTVPLCLAASWALSRDYVKCQNPVWCWNASSAPLKCELSSVSLFAADHTSQTIRTSQFTNNQFPTCFTLHLVEHGKHCIHIQ